MFTTAELEETFHDARENYERLRKAQVIRCFVCGIFPRFMDLQWRSIDSNAESEIGGREMSAICPSCRNESIIGDDSPIAILNPDLPAAMDKHMQLMGYKAGGSNGN